MGPFCLVATPTKSSSTSSSPTSTSKSNSPTANEKPESLKTAEIETRVKAACICVGADYNMTLDEVLYFIPVDQVYAYAHDSETDLTEVVREVVKRSIAIEEGLDMLATETGIDRKDLDGVTNWFDVFEYSVVHKIYLLQVMRLALSTYGAHLVGVDVEGSFKTNKTTSTSETEKPKNKVEREEVAFKHELERLRQARSIPDGKASRHEQREERQRKSRDKKVNQARGFVAGQNNK